MLQELPRSASKQQQQQEDRGEMPMALMQELAGTLGNMDESGMNGPSLPAGLTGATLHLLTLKPALALMLGYPGVAKPEDVPCMDRITLACILCGFNTCHLHGHSWLCSKSRADQHAGSSV